MGHWEVVFCFLKAVIAEPISLLTIGGNPLSFNNVHHPAFWQSYSCSSVLYFLGDLIPVCWAVSASFIKAPFEVVVKQF